MKKQHILISFCLFILIFSTIHCGPPESFQAGEKAYEAQKYEEAIRQFDAFLAENPDHELQPQARAKISTSYYKMGAQLENEGRVKEAMVMYEKALSYDPENDLLKDKIVSVFMKRAQTLVRAGYYQAAIDYVKQGLPIKIKHDALADLMSDTMFLQSQEHVKIDQLQTAKRLLQEAIQTARTPAKVDQYERVLVTAANDHLRQEDYYQAYLYFSLLTAIENNREYVNLADYARTQIKPVVEFYPTANPMPGLLDQFFNQGTQRFLSGTVQNTSQRGFLLRALADIQIFEQGKDKPRFEIKNLNLLEGQIGFLPPDEVIPPRQALPLEPMGKREFSIKIDQSIAPTDIVMVDIVNYEFETERVFGPK